jgi:hypothetical protein
LTAANGGLLLGTKQTYVAAVRRVSRGLSTLGVGKAGPPDVSHRLAHWVYSLTCVHDSLAISRLGVPWWSYRAIDKVDHWFTSRPHPIRVFEYGAGASTIWLANRADEIYSVEHHQGFAEYLSPTLHSIPTVKLLVVPPTPAVDPTTPSGKEGNQNLDFSDYVAAIDGVEGLFDLIVVDGRARQSCLTRAGRRLADDGIIIFDNSARRRYRHAIEECGLLEQRFRGLVPTLPYPDQTSVLYGPSAAGSTEAKSHHA